MFEFLLTFIVGVFAGFLILSLLTISARNELEDDILRLNFKLSEQFSLNERLKKRVKELSNENAKLFSENMRLRRGKIEAKN
ncbi:hypothetical protein SAMN02745164_00499 [Marinitoga hydrogenitolerans DSM 16785]|uniref:Uncharacterized protein n=1 Tax=Marinitoga hydrogenitolerans (strain DSM 16785 / JCM 12826 / AT1271) TaxID=1122195 RepID=A0A1M4TT38_MARH1|nr:hypothetical protein [Marinitoga hydrogenitolerans]SHE47545.1 hypothetical protein SAMN02745164_00499 [Marinitoga hydrogenitolerans DSM 16785]